MIKNGKEQYFGVSNNFFRHTYVIFLASLSPPSTKIVKPGFLQCFDYTSIAH